ncbi:uncharacterized protein KIAA1143 homolog [Halictus rubicundus]|uniref:uncharacterized protein KIAA1143 homolog n=1 Tax=Halictus rubicundus TaxID=77578 RepID=UPI004036F141
MSRKKHNVTYIKPDEPKFLREMKEQAGYKEGPTIDTKREVLPQYSDDEREDPIEEQPLVVVLNAGDLTAEEADAFKKKKEREEANERADLSKRVLFKKKKDAAEPNVADKPEKKKMKKAKREKVVLSFNDNDEDDL